MIWPSLWAHWFHFACPLFSVSNLWSWLVSIILSWLQLASISSLFQLRFHLFFSILHPFINLWVLKSQRFLHSQDSFASYSDIWTLFVNQYLKVILVLDNLLHVSFNLCSFILVLLVSFLVGLVFFVHFSHFRSVVSDCVLCFFDSCHLIRDLLLGFSKLGISLTYWLIFLIKLLIKIPFVLLILICKVLNL